MFSKASFKAICFCFWDLISPQFLHMLGNCIKRTLNPFFFLLFSFFFLFFSFFFLLFSFFYFSCHYREVSVTLGLATPSLGRSWWWFWSTWSLYKSEPFTLSRPTPCRSMVPCWREQRPWPQVAMQTMWKSACVRPITRETLVRWGIRLDVRKWFLFFPLSNVDCLRSLFSFLDSTRQT